MGFLKFLGRCITTADSLGNKNASCVIPFKYNGTLKNGCTTEDDPDGRHWCSTKVDDNLLHIAGQGNWGYCRPTCPQEALPTITTTKEPTSPQTKGNFTRSSIYN